MQWINKIKKSVKTNLMPIFFSITIIYLVWENHGNCNFIKMDLNDILTLCLLFFVSYYLVERKNDRRILNEKIEKTLTTISYELNKINKELFCEGFITKNYTVIAKRVSNKINVVKFYMSDLSIENEIKYIENAFQEIDVMIGNHINSIEELNLILVDIENKIDNIEVRIDRIFTKIF